MRMRMVLALVLAMGMGSWSLAQTPVKVEAVKPDCDLYFSLTTVSPTSYVLDNRNTGCTNWTATYQSNVFTGLTFTVEQAPDNAGTPGVWAAFAGSVLSGVNPTTSITQYNVSLFGFAPWMRVQITGLTDPGAGIVTGRLYGWRQNSAVLVAGGMGSSALSTYSGCTLSAPIALAAAGNTQVVALSVGKIIRICSVDFSTWPGEAVYLTYGTGANCATGTTSLTGVFGFVLAMDMQWEGSIATPAGKALCINQANAQTLGGVITYSQYTP